MAVIFEDAFTEAADTALTAHTPAPTGTSWVQVAVTGTRFIEVQAATDDVSGNLSSTGAGEYVKSQPAPASADVDVSIKCNTVDAGSTQARKVRIHARGTGVTDYYAARFCPPAGTVNDCELIEVVGSVVTILATVDTGIVANDVFVLEIRDALKSLLKNGSSLLSNATNNITGVGDCGLSIGQVSAADTGNIAAAWLWDDYKVTDYPAALGSLPPPPARMPHAIVAR